MLLWGAGGWLGWLKVIPCSGGWEFLLEFTLARSKKRSVVSDLCPGQPDGFIAIKILAKAPLECVSIGCCNAI